MYGSFSSTKGEFILLFSKRCVVGIQLPVGFYNRCCTHDYAVSQILFSNTFQAEDPKEHKGIVLDVTNDNQCTLDIIEENASNEVMKSFYYRD